MLLAATTLALCAQIDTTPAAPRFGGFVSESAREREPVAAAIDAADRTWIVERTSGAPLLRLAMFDGATWAPVNINVEGLRTAQSVKPIDRVDARGIAISSKGEAFVTDAYNDRVLVFDLEARKE